MIRVMMRTMITRAGIYSLVWDVMTISVLYIPLYKHQILVDRKVV